MLNYAWVLDRFGKVLRGSSTSSRSTFSRTPSKFLAVTATLLTLVPVASLEAQGPQIPNNSPPPVSAPANNGAAPTGTDKIQTVAVVNGQAISRTELASACLARYGKEVLQSMVNKMLIELECRQKNIVITEEEINQQLERVAKSVGVEGMSVQQYLQLVSEKKNISPQRIKSEIVWTDLALRKLAAGTYTVTPEEVTATINREYGPKVQVRLIVESTREQAEILLQAARKNPEQFGTLAKNYSLDQATAPYMGLSPQPFKMGDVEPAAEAVLFALQEQQISEVVELYGQFYIFKCERRYPATPLDDNQTKTVRERIQSMLATQKLDEQAPVIFRELQNRAQIVNVMNDAALAQQQPGVAALVNGQPITIETLAEECITRYGVDVLEVEVHRVLLKQQLKNANMIVTEEDLREEITRVATDAGQVDANGNVDLNQWLQRVTENDESQIDFYVQDAVWPSAALRKLVQNTVQINNDDMTKGFEANYGPRVRVLAIVTFDQKSCEKVWRMARENPTIENFQRLAETYSMENSSRFNRGEVPPIARYTGRKNLEDAAFALRENEISGIISEGGSWVILYCLGQTEPVVTDIDVVKEELYRDLMDRKTIAAMTTRLQEILAGSQIDNFLTQTAQLSRQDMDAFRRAQAAEAQKSR
ncbi:MAG: peptidylprolyl isomerase [Planctomycetaceae bacterium]|nr:peptidylprolyl isomerase [Planctomycetaceae bacterium]